MTQQDKTCYILRLAGGVPEWLKGADCKSVGLRLRWFESSLLHHGGCSVLKVPVALISGWQARFRAGVAQLVELLPSKQNVASSSLVSRSIFCALSAKFVGGRSVGLQRFANQWFSNQCRPPMWLSGRALPW